MTTTSKKYENYREISNLQEPSIMTGNKKLDDFWSKDGGMVVGSAIFLTGTSGAGKTTLSVFLSKLLNNLKVSIYSREMHRSSVMQQTKRLNITHDNLFISDEQTCPTFIEYMELLDEMKPKIVVIDSLQVIAMTDYANDNQDDAQIAMIQELRTWTMNNNAVLFVIGHNKKDGEFRGANTIMQLFDAHLEMVHDKSDDSRHMSWGQKNRKGPLCSLYYTFTKDSIEFFTVDEWEEMHPKTIGIVGFEQGLKNIINSNLKKLKKHENFKAFQDACNSDLANVQYSSLIEEMTQTIVVMEKNERKFLK